MYKCPFDFMMTKLEFVSCCFTDCRQNREKKYLHKTVEIVRVWSVSSVDIVDKLSPRGNSAISSSLKIKNLICIFLWEEKKRFWPSLCPVYLCFNITHILSNSPKVDHENLSGWVWGGDESWLETQSVTELRKIDVDQTVSRKEVYVCHLQTLKVSAIFGGTEIGSSCYKTTRLVWCRGYTGPRTRERTLTSCTLIVLAVKKQSLPRSPKSKFVTDYVDHSVLVIVVVVALLVRTLFFLV